MYLWTFNRNLKVTQVPVTGKSKYSHCRPLPILILLTFCNMLKISSIFHCVYKRVESSYLTFCPAALSNNESSFFSSIGFKLACAVVFGQPHFQCTFTHIRSCAGISIPLQSCGPPHLRDNPLQTPKLLPNLCLPYSPKSCIQQRSLHSKATNILGTIQHTKQGERRASNNKIKGNTRCLCQWTL